jgi:hypothetical protein
MSMPEAEAASGMAPGAPWTEECEQRRLSGPGGGVVGMFTSGRLVRLDVTDRGVATEAGVQVGDLAARVGERYPAAVASPHKYTDGQYLTVAIDEDRRLIFETDGAAVTRYRVGRLPEVEWVEGCA